MLCTLKLTRNADQSKLTYNGWAIAFKEKICAILVRNAVIFDADNTSPSHTDNTSSSHNFLILGKGTTNVIFDSVGATWKKLVLIFYFTIVMKVACL